MVFFKNEGLANIFCRFPMLIINIIDIFKKLRPILYAFIELEVM